MIVTFYSYKGGVGRSMALANVAKWFQLQDIKVAMIDWDLEAPGLESFFATDEFEREAMAGKLGLMDIISTHRDLLPNLLKPSDATGTGSTVNDDFVRLLTESLSPLQHFLQPIKPSAEGELGSLSLLSAGCRKKDRFSAYADAVQEFDWADLYANFNGQAYFEWIRSQLNDPSFADIVLIDSRTGVAEMSGVCTRQLADVVVILCAPNDQNLDGVAMMADSFVREDVIAARGGRSLELIFVPARVDVSEGVLNDEFKKKFQGKLRSYLPKVFSKIGTDFDTVYRQLRIPYVSAYSFTERIAIGEGAEDLQLSYSNLATHIAALAGSQSKLRKKCTASFQSVFGQSALVAIDENDNSNVTMVGWDLIQHITQIGEDPKTAQSVVAAYLSALATDLAGLKLGEIDTSTDQTKQSPLQLADIYVPLDTTLNIPKNMTLAQWRSHNFKRDDVEVQRETRPISALEALATHRKLTLLGNAGGGKSTFGASVLLNLVQVWQGHADKLKELGEHWTFGTLLPIRVILRRFAEQYGAGQPTAGDLWTFIGQELQASGYGMHADTLKYIRDLARDHGALILFDGLDECGDLQRRTRVNHAVQKFIESSGDKCRYLLTARPYAFPKGADPAQGIYMLADFDDAQIEQFIRAWYAALITRGWRSPGDAERKMADLLEVRQRHDLLPLAQNPLLLTLMTTLHTNRGRMPDDRVDLYHESVELLLLRWNRQIGADKALLDELNVSGLKLSDLREALEELAFNIHAQSVGHAGTADVGEDKLVRAFCPLLNHSKDKAGIVVEYIEKRAGLLVGQGDKDGERQFTFPHRTFQEFLAACHLSASDDFPELCDQLARQAVGHWQVVLTLAARIAKAERGGSAADALIHGKSIAEYRVKQPPTPTDWACAQLAGNQLLEIGLGAIRKKERTHAIAERVADWLVAGLSLHPDQGGAPAIQRAQMGDVLSQLGDPRFDPQRLYLPNDEMLGFEFIPEDPQFRIGTRKADKQKASASSSEINDAITPVSAGYLARYPVTVAQFRAFVEATQFELGDQDALRDPDNHPVRWVSWHEARAYCDWLNQQLLTHSTLQASPVAQWVREGWRIGLPSELEWEHAARGGKRDLVYPWGDQPDPNRANYRETGIANTSSVGCFLPNDYGLYDMSGNVWEWTRSLWGKDWQKAGYSYPYVADDGRENLEAGDEVRRVLRGGSWGYDPRNSRAANRDFFTPAGRDYDVGFRLARTLP